MGCEKQEAAVAGSSDQINATKFRPAFSSAPPDTQAIVDNVMMAIQGSDPVKARAELDRLAKAPGVTDAQQAVIKDLSEQLDRKIARNAEAAIPK